MFSNLNKSFSPEEAIDQIRENSQLIQEYGEAIIQARLNLIEKEAQYIDAKHQSRIKRMAEMSITAANNCVEIDTAREKKEYIIAEHVLKNAIERKDIIVEVNNNLKVQIKLWELEKQNLQYN